MKKHRETRLFAKEFYSIMFFLLFYLIFLQKMEKFTRCLYFYNSCNKNCFVTFLIFAFNILMLNI